MKYQTQLEPLCVATTQLLPDVFLQTSQRPSCRRKSSIPGEALDQSTSRDVEMCLPTPRVLFENLWKQAKWSKIIKDDQTWQHWTAHYGAWESRRVKMTWPTDTHGAFFRLWNYVASLGDSNGRRQGVERGSLDDGMWRERDVTEMKVGWHWQAQKDQKARWNWEINMDMHPGRWKGDIVGWKWLDVRKAGDWLTVISPGQNHELSCQCADTISYYIYSI